MAIYSYKKKDGKTYYKVKVHIGNGKYSSEQPFISKADAQKAEARMNLDKERLKRKKHSLTKSYRDVYDLWVIEYERRVEESTYIKTIGIFKNHILPAIGDVRIDKLDYKTCQEAVNKWSDDLKNYRAVKSYAASVVNFALRHDYVLSNPFSLVEPIIKKKEITLDDEEESKNFYNKEQLNTFLECMKQERNVKAHVFFRLLAYSGMRTGEALGLTWRDIVFKDNEIRINKALSRGKDNRLYLKVPKNRKSRTVKMDEETMAILKKWKKQQHEEYAALGFNTLRPTQLVFSNEVNEFLQLTRPRKWLVHVLKKYNLPKITNHGFRHTHTSLLIEVGVSEKETQDRLGHSDIRTTLNTYTHLSERAKDEAIDKFSEYLSM